MTARADWRFLKPGGTFGHLVLLGGPPGMAQWLGETGIANRVSETVGHDGVDAVAVLQGTTIGLSEAVRCLAPGGWLYWETSERPTLRSARAALGRATARVRASGLRVAGVWAVWPSFDRDEVYIPAEALAWFARTVHPTRTFEERARGMALRLLARLGPLSGAVITPCFAITAVAGPVRDASKPVILTHGVERVILIPFPPHRVIKVPRLPVFNAKTLREQETLAEIRGRLQPETARALPEPGGTVRYGEVVASVESYAPGRSMVLTRGGENDLRLAAEWLTRFHLQTMLGREPWNGSRIAGAFAAWRDRIGTTVAEAALLDLALARSRELAGVPFPIVWQHRDFTPWNLLRNGKGRLSILDWEGAQRGPALCDLLHFVNHWDELAAGAVTPEERLRAFSLGAAASRREVTRYCERLGIDVRFIPLMLVYTRIEIALRDPEGTIDARYVAALADRAGDLFQGEHLHAT